MRVALLFTDGVGVGRRDPGCNPLARGTYMLSQFEDDSGEPLPNGGTVHSVDATFGVPGRPQSASNQTALLTGLPAPALLGAHSLGFPNAALRALLQESSLIRRLVQRGLTAEFVNAYPAGYLDALGLAHRQSDAADVVIPERARRRLKPSATTSAFAAGPVCLRTFTDARRGVGLTADIDARRARERGFDVPLRTAQEAAEIFWRVGRGVDFTFFEHYLADEAGHAQDWVLAAEALQGFDAFARAVVAMRPDRTLLLICSDHGNVEDLSSRNHTLARVPLLAFGPGNEHAGTPRDLAEVGAWILARLGIGGEGK